MLTKLYLPVSGTSRRFIGPKKLLALVTVGALAIGIGGCSPDRAEASPAISAQASAAVAGASVSPAKAKKASINLKRHSTTKFTSTWVVVNKKRPIKPKKSVPKGLTSVALAGTTGKLRAPAASALKKLAKAAKKSTGKRMTITSSYRSYTTQVSVYNKWKSINGKKQADLLSARPGYSEHQTGLAVDIGQQGSGCALEQCFVTTSIGKWVAKKAWKYGFVVRYPKGKTSVTGYSYEPWHLRYVGVELATYMHQKGIKTLEEAFSLGKAAKY